MVNLKFVLELARVSFVLRLHVGLAYLEMTTWYTFNINVTSRAKTFLMASRFEMDSRS